MSCIYSHFINFFLFLSFLLQPSFGTRMVAAAVRYQQQLHREMQKTNIFYIKNKKKTNKLPAIYIAKQIINIFQKENLLHLRHKNYYAYCHPQLINCLVKIINETFFLSVYLRYMLGSVTELTVVPHNKLNAKASQEIHNNIFLRFPFFLLLLLRGLNVFFLLFGRVFF